MNKINSTDASLLRRSEASRRNWATVTAGDRSRIMSERARARWAKATPEQRRAQADAMARGRRTSAGDGK